MDEQLHGIFFLNIYKNILLIKKKTKQHNTTQHKNKKKGYYLHGKSASGCSEGNTNYLKLTLDREAKSSNTRGLIKGEDL
jgi:hypothetical protein